MYVNPFRSDDALETLSFPGREKEHKALSAALVSGRHLAFTAPRGKTVLSASQNYSAPLQEKMPAKPHRNFSTSRTATRITHGYWELPFLINSVFTDALCKTVRLKPLWLKSSPGTT